MKKIVFAILAVLILILLYKKEDFVVIPDTSIRIRIISNSNSIEDLY